MLYRLCTSVHTMCTECTAVAGTSHLVPSVPGRLARPGPAPLLCHNPLTMPHLPHSPQVQVSPWSLPHIARLLTTASDYTVDRKHRQDVSRDDDVVNCVIGFRESKFCLKVKWFSLPQNTVSRSCVLRT